MADLKVNLYDMNKSILNKMEPLTYNQISKKMSLIEDFHNSNYSRHYMLLSNENRYYTVFESDLTLTLPTFSGAVCEIISNLGKVYSIEKTRDGTGIEIWIKMKDKEEVSVFYLFPYDQGVVYYG